MVSVGNMFLTKCQVSIHEAIKRVSSLHIKHLSTDVLCVPTSLKKNRTRVLKSPPIVEEMHPDDTNISNIIDKYENQQDLHSMCLTNFTSSYVSKKTSDASVESDGIKNCCIPVPNISDYGSNWIQTHNHLVRKQTPAI